METKNDLVKDTPKKKRNKLWVIILDIIFGLIVTIGIVLFFIIQGYFFYGYYTYVPVNVDIRAINLIAVIIAAVIFAIILFAQFVIYSILTIITAIFKRWHLPFFTVTHASLSLLNVASVILAFILLYQNGNIG